MSGSGRTRVDLALGMSGLGHVLTRAGAGRGMACVVDEHGAVVADLLRDGAFTVVLPQGLGVALVGLETPWCGCASPAVPYGCLVATRAGDASVTLTGRCTQVLAQALGSVVRAHRGTLFMELADPSVLPRGWRYTTFTLPVVASPARADADVVGAAAPAGSRGGGGRGERAWSGVGGGQCVDCNRWLSDAVSIKRRRGEICEGRHQRSRRAMAAR